MKKKKNRIKLDRRVKKISLAYFALFFVLFGALLVPSLVHALYLGVVDGYILNTTGDTVSGADVEVELSDCTGDGCSGSYVSEGDGYYYVGNLDFQAGRQITVNANKSNYHGVNDTESATDTSTPVRANVTMCSAPNAPTLNLHPDTHNKSINLSWTSGGGTQDNYRFKEKGGSYSYVYDASSPQIESALEYNTNYTWEVQSCDGDCCSAWSVDYVYVFNNPPADPVLTDQTDTLETNVTLYWTSNFTRGEYYDDDGDLVHDEYQFNGGTINDSADSPQTEEGLDYGSYTWRVRSCDNTSDPTTGCTDWISDTFSVVNNPPATPSLDAQENNISTTRTFSWTSNSSGAGGSGQDEDGDPVTDSFYITTGTSGCTGDFFSNSSANSPQVVGGLVPDTTYTWCVKSCDNKGACSQATDTFSVTNDPPPDPVLVDEPHTSSTTVEFEWTNYSDPDGDPTYNEFQISTDENFASLFDNSSSAESGYSVTGLSTFTFYYWRVRTCDNKNECSGWDTDSFFTYSCPSCPPCSCPSCDCPSCGDVTCPVCPTEEVCYSDWECGDWSSCTEEGFSYRTCSDENNCEITMDEIPDLRQSCSFIPVVCPEANVTVVEKEVLVEKPVIVKEIEKLFKKEKVNITTSISKENAEISNIGSCDPSWLKRVEFVDSRDFEIPEEAVIVNRPFKVDCIDTSALLTVSVPDKYSNVKALRCTDKNNCVEVPLTKLDELGCGIDILEQAYEKEIELGDIKTVQRKTALINPGSNKVISGKYSVAFDNFDQNFNIILGSGSELAPQNPSLRVVSSQLELQFSEIPNEDMEIEIELPYVKQNIDESSVGIYIRNFKGQADEWAYLNGELNTKTRKIKTTLNDVDEYLSNDFKLVFTAIAPICIACEGVEFTNVYNPVPITKDAVVMIHGLGSSPATFSSIINDIKITNQPWQVWTYGYPTDDDFISISRRFANKLEENNENYENIYLVAHSLGGLVTQQALRYAYEQNIQRPRTYNFVNKVRKVILIGTPNKGSPGAEVYQNLFSETAAKGEAVENLVNTNNPIMDILLQGKEIPRVPGIDYRVIAGTRPYDLFSQRIFEEGVVNDGVVSTESATYVGGSYINDLCENYWEIGTTHTDLLKNPVSRKVVEQIIAKEIAEVIGAESTVGLISYYELDDNSCNDDSTYVFIGEETVDELQFDETGCACGNGYCGVGENELNCPSDCAAFFREENFCIILLFIIMFSSILFAIFLVIAVNKMYSVLEFSNTAIIPMIFIITSMIAMITYVLNGCYVVWVFRTLTIVISVIAIAAAVVVVSIIVVKNRIRMHLATLKRKDELKKLEEYVFKIFEMNEERIKRKLHRVGWKNEDIKNALNKAKKKKTKIK